jgi:hypothetical protein
MMTKDDIIKLCKEADIEIIIGDSGIEEAWVKFEKFANLIAAAEREACAIVAESYEPECDTCPSGVSNAIRARGQE